MASSHKRGRPRSSQELLKCPVRTDAESEIVMIKIGKRFRIRKITSRENGSNEISTDSAAAGLAPRADTGLNMASSHKRGRPGSPLESLKFMLRTDNESEI